MSEELTSKEENIEIQYVPVEEIDTEGTLVASVNFRPLSSIVICYILGVAIAVATRNVVGILLGVFFVLYATFSLVKVEDFKCVDIYNDFLVIYNNTQHDLAVKIDFDDIYEWHTVDLMSGNQGIAVTTNDGRKVLSDSLNYRKFYNHMDKLLPDKEQRVILKAENAKNGVKFKDLFKRKKK